MSWRKNAFEFYLNSSVHVATSVVALSLVTQVQYNIQPDLVLLLFIFFGTITGYNFVKYAGIAKLHHRSLARGLRGIQVFSFLSFLVLVILLFQVPVKTILYAGGLGLLTLLYAIPVFRRKRNLRSFPSIKVFIIATVWAGVTVILPLVDHTSIISLEVQIEFLQRFLLVLVLILPFEIRDLRYDLEWLQTIPQRFGVTKTKIIGSLLLLLVWMLEFLQAANGGATLGALSIMVIMTGILLWKAEEDQSEYFSSFWVEGLPVFWLAWLIFLSLV